MRITLKRHSVSHFQNLGSDQAFVPTNGLWSVIGRNEDDGGSNASGKSSFVRSIIVGLLGVEFCNVTIKELKNRFTGEKPVIDQEYDVDGKTLTINRTIGGKLSATYEGKELEGKNEDVQEKINKILKLTPQQINYLTNKAQGEFGGFLKMKESAKKDFLGSFFDLEKLEAAQDTISNDLSAKVKQAEEAMTKISALRVRASELDPRIAETTGQIAERVSAEFTAQEVLVSTRILELEQERVAANTKLDAIGRDSKNLKPESPQYPAMLEAVERVKLIAEADAPIINALNVRLGEIVQAMSARPQIPAELTENLSLIDQAISNFHKTMGEKSTLRAKESALSEKYFEASTHLTNMKPNACTTCGQPISLHKFEELRSGASEKVKMLEQELQAVQGSLTSLQAFCTGNEIAGMTAARDEAVAKIEVFKKSFDTTTLKTEQQEIQYKITSMNTVLQTARRELESLEQSVTDYAVTAFRALQGRVKEIDDGLMSLRALQKERADKLAQLRATLLDLETKRQNLSKDLVRFEQEHAAAMEEVTVLTKTAEILSKHGFLGYIFDSILDELNAHLNENLKSIPVSAKLSLMFTPDKLVKTTKAISKNINYKMWSGTEEVSLDTLSGGEQLSVIVSVDEALDTVLSTRLGVNLSWKVFDEQFFWVDGHSKEQVLEFLRLKSVDKTYIVIDHASEFNAAIDNRIVVTKKNGVATVEVCQ